jgi:hypothetical protein
VKRLYIHICIYTGFQRHPGNDVLNCVTTFSSRSRSFETADFARLAESINKRCNDFLPHKVGKYSAPLKVVYLNYLSQAGREKWLIGPIIRLSIIHLNKRTAGSHVMLMFFPI